MNLAPFYDHVRKHVFGGSIKPGQFEGLNLLVPGVIAEWPDLRYGAYALATAFWETARTMKPIREFGRGKGRPYGKPHPVTGLVYYGRGYVQLTWYDNYKLYGLERTPEKALEHPTALHVMLDGMEAGRFTGKKLSDYFNAKQTAWRGARRIINGTDHATEIANIAFEFYKGLTLAASA